jgi:hypothetical protein
MSIVTCTLDLTCKFIDLEKYSEKTNSQTNKKSQWCHIFKNRGSSRHHTGESTSSLLLAVHGRPHMLARKLSNEHE